MTRLSWCVLVLAPLATFTRAGEMPGGPTHDNSLGMEMVRIEPGSFSMGSSTGGDFDERPVHRVTIGNPFYLGATEVTNAQYEQFDPEHRRLRGRLGFSTEDDEAVVFVTWHDAVGFCRWLSEKEGLPYRLPTEAEWEYACRAGTTTPYHTGPSLSEPFHKNVTISWFPGSNRGNDVPVKLHVGRTPPNPWGLFDVHGNVEEWCHDWYGPYRTADQTEPVGYAGGDFRVTRGGSHSTTLEYLRSANRLGTLPDDKSWMIGFRVALGPMPSTEPLAEPASPRHQQNVSQEVPPDLADGPDPAEPYFRGPREYVKIPPGSEGPLFSRHNHCPALVPCPNGDLLAAWYTCRTEPGRELGIAASRLRYGRDEWEPAAPFWDAPDRNDHATAMWNDQSGRLFHFNGLSAAATWGSLATIQRTSTDNGATWSEARLIMPEHSLHHMPIESVFRARDGTILLLCDAVPGGSGGSTVLASRDDGRTWIDVAEGKPTPEFVDGGSGAYIAGIHAGVVQLADGRLLAFGRGNNIDGRMPKSISNDMGRTWTYSTSPFPPISGGQRLVILRLQEGPIFFASFGREMKMTDATGAERAVSGLFAALSMDEGETWPVRRLITDDGLPRVVDGGGNTGKFILGPDSAEPRGYLSVCQTPDGVIQLITSKQHYAFNLAWLRTPMPPVPAPPAAEDLPAKADLARRFIAHDLPTRTGPWRFTGSGRPEAEGVSFTEPSGMKIDTGPGQRTRWADDSADGFAGVDPSRGFTAQITMQVLKSTSPDRGIDFEIYVGDDPRLGSRYFITVTTKAVFWSGPGPREAVAEGLDNAGAMHTYRLSVRPDAVAQIYRDAELLAVRRPPSGADRLVKAAGSYLQWGEGAGASEADAVVAEVSYDLSGAFGPGDAHGP